MPNAPGAGTGGKEKDSRFVWGGRVRVNAIEPAAIATEMLKAGFAGEPERYVEFRSNSGDSILNS